MATWAEFERADPELAAFGRERVEGQVCFHATLRTRRLARVHPVEPWIAAGLLLVLFPRAAPEGGRGPGDGRYALHTPMDNQEGEGGEFMVSGWMEQVADDIRRSQRPYTTRRTVAFYAMSVEEAVGTTYEGEGPEPATGAGDLRRRGRGSRRARRTVTGRGPRLHPALDVRGVEARACNIIDASSLRLPVGR